jgi:dipeptidyl aminopeptidase/acylaminoacyl peptidase
MVPRAGGDGRVIDDGSAPVVVSAASITMPGAVEWAPDGASLLVNDADMRLTRYFVDGSPSRLLLEEVHLEPDAFRPPDGAQILYEREDHPGTLYAMNENGTGVRQLFGPVTAPCACGLAGPARWSPDGRRIAFPVSPDGVQARMFVMNADGTAPRKLADEAGVWVENDPAWSPDGDRIAFNRWQRDDAGDWHVRTIAIAPAAGGEIRSVGVAPAEGGALIEWAPDGRSILSLPGTLAEAFTWSPNADGTVARPVLIDLADGSSPQLNWSVASTSSWQRLAP